MPFLDEREAEVPKKEEKKNSHQRMIAILEFGRQVT